MIPPIPALPALPALPSNPVTTATAATGSGDQFSQLLSNAVTSLQSAQSNASQLEAQAAAGNGNLADTMVAAQQATLDTQVTTSLVTKAAAAYDAVMNMSF
jgi:flagellar hook-basal body complex protein FliE